MASLQMIHPNIKIALMQLDELKWNNMSQDWKNAMIYNVNQAQQQLNDVAENLSTVVLNESNCD